MSKRERHASGAVHRRRARTRVPNSRAHRATLPRPHRAFLAASAADGGGASAITASRAGITTHGTSAQRRAWVLERAPLRGSSGGAGLCEVTRQRWELPVRGGGGGRLPIRQELRK